MQTCLGGRLAWFDTRINQLPGVEQAGHPSTLQASHTESEAAKLHRVNFTGIQHPAAHSITTIPRRCLANNIYAGIARQQGRETLFHPQPLHVISTPHTSLSLCPCLLLFLSIIWHALFRQPTHILTHSAVATKDLMNHMPALPLQ